MGFPGGFVEKGETVFEGALREMKEEIGIGRKDFSLISKLDNQFTLNKIEVVPYIGCINSTSFRLSSKEVEEIYFFSVEILLRIKKDTVTMKDGRKTIKYRIGNTVIWGLSANIINNSISVLTSISQIIQNRY
jgi:ADP-ribose pyrophosphatase YjhB (NUDIX family)